MILIQLSNQFRGILLENLIYDDKNNTVMQSNPYELRDIRNRGYLDRNKASRLLLICVYDTVALEVSNQLIYERFSRFGSFLKVLIFEKGEVTKLFVEFAEREHAHRY
jgi:hypothetical protein